MLEHTFVHIQGIGKKTEERFWDAGIHQWDDFKFPFPVKISGGKADFVNEQLEESRSNLSDNPGFFAKMLPSNQHWRLFSHYRNSVAYLDIETTGLGGYGDHITTIAVYDGTEIYYYVYGENLDGFVNDIRQYSLLVTYNGKTFDIPFIEKSFGIKLNTAHIDLRYILHNLGYKGGLKGCEKQFGLDRGELDGVDGYFAVLLWQEYKRTGAKEALETLLAYNIEDVVNLETLMFHAYNINVKKTPFHNKLQLQMPAASPEPPFSPNRKLIEKIKANYQPQSYY
jgi:uncharacterized protein YprB with RNaseH-like and TPR domain